MTTHARTAFDNHHTVYNNRTYVCRTYSSTRNQLFHPHLIPLPIPSVNLCNFLLYETKLAENVGPTTSSLSYVHTNEQYDNTYAHTYDNPVECFENLNVKQSLINLPPGNGNMCDNIKDKQMNEDDKYGSSKSAHSSSPILFYLENKRLAFYACFISFLLLLIIGIGLFVLNKFIRPVVITTTVNHHYDLMNISNTSTISSIPRTTITPSLIRILTTNNPVPTSPIKSVDSPFSFSICSPDRWGIECENLCKPCGLGVCHPVTGKCLCPEDIYGEYCDLSKVNDKPKRGDMTS